MTKFELNHTKYRTQEIISVRYVIKEIRNHSWLVYGKARTTVLLTSWCFSVYTGGDSTHLLTHCYGLSYFRTTHLGKKNENDNLAQTKARTQLPIYARIASYPWRLNYSRKVAKNIPKANWGNGPASLVFLHVTACHFNVWRVHITLLSATICLRVAVFLGIEQAVDITQHPGFSYKLL